MIDRTSPDWTPPDDTLLRAVIAAFYGVDPRAGLIVVPGITARSHPPKQRTRRKSRYVGVSWHQSGRWCAVWRVKRTRTFVYTDASEQGERDAALIYARHKGLSEPIERKVKDA